MVTPKLFSVILTWGVPEQPNGVILHYTIQYSVNGAIYTTTDNSTSYSITGLSSSTPVTNIAISATTGGGEGPPGFGRNVTTLNRPGM